MRAHRIGYFGKLPSRTDFVKSNHDGTVLGVLDEWLAAVMAALPSDARWKVHYDAMAPLHFAFVGLQRRHALAGHIIGSSDQSGRRFPFLLTRTIDVADPHAFIRECPLVLAPLWTGMATLAHSITAAADPAAHLASANEQGGALAEHCGTALDAFLDTGTVSSLAALLGRADTARMILALGIVMRPIMHHPSDDLEKSLVLPLPESAPARYAVAAFWLALVVPFLRGRDVELALFVTRIAQEPMLVIGFAGASARTMQAIIDPLLARELQVGFGDTAWVDEQQGLDVDFRALSSYLEQAQMPLRLARDLFLQTYIGEPT
jgi:type VI secretion system protein ImpM